MIKRYSSFCALAALTASLAGCGPDFPMSGTGDQIVYPAAPARIITPAGRTNFISKAAGCALWLPGRPTVTQISILSTSGQKDTASIELDTETLSYMIMATKLPGVYSAVSQKAFLQGTQRGFVQKSGSKLLETQDISLNGVPGREFQTTLLGGLERARCRVYCTHTMCYHMVAVGLASDIRGQKAEIEKVFNSLRILSGPTDGPATKRPRHIRL